MKNFFRLILVLLYVLLLTCSVAAHSGRTDSSGGHKDNKNASGLGSYHYHHGEGPHLHPGGVCPYDVSVPAVAVITPTPVPQDTINISNQPNSLNVGDAINLEWQVITYSENSDVSWSSSDSSVVSVDKGMLTAKKAGSATITATLKNGAHSFSVTINEVMVSSIEIKDKPNKIEVNGSVQINSVIVPENATNKTLKYNSSNTEVATINSNGVIKALKNGVTTITVETSNALTNSFEIEVYSIEATGVKINISENNLYIGEIVELTAQVLPTNTTNTEVVWDSSDVSIAKINGTSLELLKDGEVIISATCSDVETSMKLIILPIPTDYIEFDENFLNTIEHTIDINETVEPLVNIFPANVTYKNVQYTSSNPEVISVENGKLVANSYGKATITAQNNGKSSTIELEVKSPLIIYFLIAAIVVIASLVGGTYFYKHKSRY